jgi:hypothetical protein
MKRGDVEAQEKSMQALRSGCTVVVLLFMAEPLCWYNFRDANGIFRVFRRRINIAYAGMLGRPGISWAILSVSFEITGLSLHSALCQLTRWWRLSTNIIGFERHVLTERWTGGGTRRQCQIRSCASAAESRRQVPCW